MGPKKRKKKSKPKVPVAPRNANLPHKFQEGDVVWCKWYSRYYRAIILRLTVELGGEHYYGIHYWKFAKSWDMTVSEERLLPWTSENNKFVKKLHQELYQAKKKKKLEDKLISEIKKNITEKPIQQQYPFLTLTDIRPLLKGYVPSEVHHSAEESVQSSSSQFSPSLTFVIYDDHYELKNLSIQNPTIMESVPEKNIEPVIVNGDCENQKMGLFKEFSSKEKDVINVLDNMRTNNMKFRSSSSQRKQEVEYEDSAMPISKEHLRLDDLEDDSIDGSVNDGDDLMEYENATSSKEEEELQCDQEDYTSKNSSVDHEPGCEVNNILTILNDEPCHISNIFVKDALSSQLEKNFNSNENTNFDINALLITENNLNNSKRNTCIMEEDETLYKSNISKKVDNLTKLENILIGKKSGIISKDIISLNEHHDQSVIIPVPSIQKTTETNINDCKFESYEAISYIKKTKLHKIQKNRKLTNVDIYIDQDEFVVSKSQLGIISKDISLNEYNDQSVFIPVPSIQTTIETNINEVELACSEAIGYIKKPKLHKKQKNRKLTNVDIHIDQDGPVVRNSQLGIISKDISLNEFHGKSVIIPVPSFQTTIETNINEVQFTSSEAIDYVKKPKLHKKQKKRKLTNVDIHIDQDELVVNKSQLGITSKDISINEYYDQSVIRPVPSLQTTIETNINEVELASSEGIISKDISLNEYNDQSISIPVPSIQTTIDSNINEVEFTSSEAIGYIKKPKRHKKQKNRKLKNVDIHIDQDEPVVRNSQLGIISKDISINEYYDQSVIRPVPSLQTTIETNIKEVELASTEAIGYVKKPKLHKKQKNRKLRNVDTHIDQDELVISKSQLGIISKDISLNEYNDQSVSIPFPSVQTTTKRNINEVELACSEAVGHMKKPKLHKKQKIRKLKNVDIYIDQDELVLSNSQLDFPFHKNISLNKLNHSVVPALSNIVVTNSKEINDDECETVKEPLHNDNGSSNENDHSILTMLPISSTQINKRKIHNEISYENEFNILKKTIESSSTESINKEKIDDLEYEIDDGNHVENLEMLQKHEKKNSKNANIYLDKDDIVISENGLFPNQISHFTPNENWSCGSTSSSTSASMILNTRAESDDDIDGHTTDDDDQYVKNRKVSKKKLKQSYDVDRNIYELFAYDKSYSRAAKVKANEAISQMSKPPISKEKKSDVGKRPKNGKKKEDDEPWNFQSKLSDYNLNVPNCVLQNLTEDKHLIEDDRFIPIVPAKLSVYDIISDYSLKFQRCFSTMDLLLDSFDRALGFWLLHPLEKPKHEEMLSRYPNTPMSQIYGLPHLLRFIMKLPKLFSLYKNILADSLPDAIYFVDGLFVYLVDEDYKINIANYDCVMPDYYRMAYS